MSEPTSPLTPREGEVLSRPVKLAGVGLSFLAAAHVVASDGYIIVTAILLMAATVFLVPAIAVLGAGILR